MKNIETTEQITTITFFKYTRLASKIWAFGMMQTAHHHLKKIPGLEWYKLLGTGKDSGFNPLPNWSVYSLLMVWKNEAAADNFFKSAPIFKQYQQQTKEIWTLYLKNLLSRGSWKKQNPFTVHPEIDPNNSLLAIITRATIRNSKLWAFWRFVPTAHKPLFNTPGILFSKGIGEVPIKQNATFSIWKDKAALQAFAYKSPEHLKAMRRTRQENWYSEELFARFQPYKSIGTWNGKNMPGIE